MTVSLNGGVLIRGQLDMFRILPPIDDPAREDMPTIDKVYGNLFLILYRGVGQHGSYRL
jgi:hypothetical protein